MGTSDRVIRFGVIGCGVISQRHAEEILAIEDAELVAVADVEPSRAEAFGQRYGIDWYDDFHFLLDRTDIDVINVCTPSGMHARFATAAARAGKHVIVEKPIDISLPKADEMIESCRRAGVKLCVISQHRFDPATIKVKQMMMEGALGRPILGEAAVNWYRSQGYYDSAEWRGTWEWDGGGVLMNQSIHTIDLLQYLMGPVESVQAHMGTLNHDRIEVEDVAVAIVRFRNGGLGTIVGTTAAYPGLSARLEIFGTQGSAVIDSDKLTHLYVAKGGIEGGQYKVEAENLAETELEVDVAYPSAHRLQFLDMMNAIRENREPLVNGEEGRKGLEIIQAIYQSARTGSAVSLPIQ
jgi:UDP-N-acetyl-2-amino-2-deoxyglucuronate dehydrogenase